MIGQIVNCPKCNSMLQITNPAEVEDPSSHLPGNALRSGEARQIRVESHRGVIDSSALTKEAFAPEIEDEYRLAPSLPIDSEPEPPSTPLVAPPRIDEEPVFQEAFSAPPPPDRKPTGGPTVDPTTIQMLAVQRTARRRQVLMVAVLGSSGVLLAGMLFAGFLYWYSGSGKSSQAKANVANNPVNAESSEGGATEPKHVGPKKEHEQDLALDPVEPNETDLMPASETASSNAENLPLKEDQASEDKNTIGSAVANVLANPEGASNDPVTPPPAEQAAAPSSDNASKPASETELPEQLKKFQGILEISIEPQFLEDQPIEKAPPTAKELGLTAGADSKALPPVDVENQMQLTVTGLMIPPNSFSNVVSQWVQVSGVPTVVDLDSLVAAGINRYKPTTKLLFGNATPLAQVGASIAKDFGVDLNTIENRFVAFQASEASIRAGLPTSVRISDIAPDAAQQQWLVKTLDQIWPEYEGKWIVQNGELTVDPVAVDTIAWFWALRVLETWRLAAGAESQLDPAKYDPTLFTMKFVDPDQIPGLNKPLNITLIDRAPWLIWLQRFVPRIKCMLGSIGPASVKGDSALAQSIS